MEPPTLPPSANHAEGSYSDHSSRPKAFDTQGQLPPVPAQGAVKGNGADETEEDEAAKQKRRRIWAACENCRKRKARCNGEQPCKACMSLARTTMPRNGARPDGSPSPEEVLQRAHSICVFDWNRKPRGPKSKGDVTGKSSNRPRASKGQPRSERSAGPAYVEAAGGLFAAQQAAAAATAAAAAAAAAAAQVVGSNGNGEYGAEAGPSSWPAQHATYDPSSMGPPDSRYSSGRDRSGSSSNGFAGQLSPHGYAPSATSVSPSTTSSTPGGYYSSSSYTPSTHTSHSPHQQSFPQTSPRPPRGSGYGSPPWPQHGQAGPSPTGVSPGSSVSPAHQAQGLATGRGTASKRGGRGGRGLRMDRTADPRHAGVAGPASGEGVDNGGGSWQHSQSMQASGAVAAENVPWGTSGAPGVDGGAAGYAAHVGPGQGYDAQAHELELAANPPWFIGPDGYDNRPLTFSPGETAPPMSPRTINMHNRRASHTLNLLNALREHYDEADRPYIALAVAQFSDLDASTKLFPSRYIFGQADDKRMPAPPTPAHLQIALLSLLAHRALLLPAERSSKDLDLADHEKKAAVVNVEMPEGSDPDGLLQWELEHVEGELTKDAREAMLNFARRSWNISHGMMLRMIDDGVVDPQLVVTGYLLDMAASEDGIGSQSMAQMKAWLFDIVFSWNLHLLDSAPELEVIPPEEVGQPSNSGFAPAGAPTPRRADARHVITDLVDREAIRRVVLYISASFIWTHSDMFENTPFDLTRLMLNQVGADDVIHKSSAWIPRYSAGPPVMSVIQVDFMVLGRVLRMLHTPLDDLINNRGPEPDLQKAITEMEMAMDWAKSCTPKPKCDGTELPIFIAAFMHTRTVEVMTWRLFATLVLFQGFVAMEPQIVHEAQGVRPGPMMFPKFNEGQIHDSMHDLLAGGTGSATSLALQRGAKDGLNGSLLEEHQQQQQQQHQQQHQQSFDAGQVNAAPRGKLRVSRDPSAASMVPLFEVDDVVRKTLTLLESTAQPTTGEVGTAAGVSILSVARSMRWPRHLKTFARHAFALAAEAEATRDSWQSFYERLEPDPGWTVPATHKEIPQASSATTQALWEAGSRIIDLLRALGKTGSSHATNTAEAVERYKAERIQWMSEQLGRREGSLNQ